MKFCSVCVTRGFLKVMTSSISVWDQPAVVTSTAMAQNLGAMREEVTNMVEKITLLENKLQNAEKDETWTWVTRLQVTEQILLCGI